MANPKSLRPQLKDGFVGSAARRAIIGRFFLAALIGCCAASFSSADAQILNPVRGGGYITFDSGYPGGVFTTGIVNPIPAGGIFLERFYNPLAFGTSRGGTALRVLISANRMGYFFAVPINSYLQQLRRSCPLFGATPPAFIKIHFDIHFDIGPAGLAGGPFLIAYPLSVANTFGLGSYSAFQTHFMFAEVVGGVQIPIGQGGFTSRFPFRGQVFQGIVPRPGEYQPIFLPNIPPNSEFIVWGDLQFTTLGCPIRPFGTAGADMSERPSVVGPLNGEESTDWQFPDFKSDPKTDYEDIDPKLIMDMNPFEPFVGCAGSCGDFSPDGCGCDELCTDRGDCCSDQFLCGYGSQGCADYCGSSSPLGCYCDSECTKFGDCCPDAAVCTNVTE